MEFPALNEFIDLNTEKQYELLNVMMLSGMDDSIDENLQSWTISSISSKLISLNLVF